MKNPAYEQIQARKGKARLRMLQHAQRISGSRSWNIESLPIAISGDLLRLAMSGTVTRHTERDQIPFGIIAQFAAEPEVVYLELPRRTAILALPAVAIEHTAAKLAIVFRLKP